MFTIRLSLNDMLPRQTVTLRWAPNWNLDRGGRVLPRLRVEGLTL